MNKKTYKLFSIFMVLVFVSIITLNPVGNSIAMSQNDELNRINTKPIYAVSKGTVQSSHTPALDSNGDGIYEIDNAEKLLWFSDQINGGNNTINGILTADISLNGKIKVLSNGVLRNKFKTRAKKVVWTPIGTPSSRFSGIFDGNGFSITGLYCDDPAQSYVGLFGYSTGTIKNIVILDSYFKGKSNIGSVCGYNTGAISNCLSRATVDGEYEHTGGVCGCNYDGTILQSYNEGIVNGKNYVGGVCGNNGGIMNDCHNTGKITGQSYVGGVNGMGHYGSMSNCYNSGSIVGTGDFIGGLCGHNAFQSTINNSYNAGSVEGLNNVGSIAGQNESSGTILQCYNTANIKGTEKVGGMCGYNYGTVDSCYNEGTITGVIDVGGSVGCNYGEVRSCYNIGSITAEKNIGGIVGYTIDGSIVNCYNNSDVFTGNIIGYSDMQDLTLVKESENKKSAQFASGEVTYNLNHGITDGTQLWYQTCGQGNPKYTGETVYYYADNCTGLNGRFSNQVEQVTITHAGTNENGFCSVCGKYYEEPQLDENGYYLINNAGKLYWFSEYANGVDQGAMGKITADIIVNNSVLVNGELNKDTNAVSSFRPWIPIGTYDKEFTGELQGNNHSISGLYFDNNNLDCIGLIGYTSGIISDVTVKDSYFNGNHHIGGICGGIWGGEIRNCYSEAYVNGIEIVGGICGHNLYGTITKCFNSGSVNGETDIGGICGFNEESYVTQCSNIGAVTGITNTGGICGNQFGDIDNSYNSGSVAGTTNTGGLFGLSEYSTVSKCYNVGTITGTTNTGALCGNVSGGQMSQCYYDMDTHIGKDFGTSSTQMPTSLSETKGLKTSTITSGELCYLLNDSISDGNQIWYQNIDTGIKDTSPVLDNSHNAVYKGFICNENVTGYTNNSASTPRGYHSFENDVCTVCGKHKTIVEIEDRAENLTVSNNTVKNVKEELQTETLYIKIFDTSGNDITDINDALVGTAYVITFYQRNDNAEVKTLYGVMKGDMNSDGVVNNNDVTIHTQYSSGTLAIDNKYIILAGDVNNDTATDGFDTIKLDLTVNKQ